MIAQRVPLINKKTGLISREWFLFFSALQNSADSQLMANALDIYADNAAALTAGLVAGQFYRTSTGQLMVVY